MSFDALQSIDEPRPLPARVLVLGSSGMVGRSWIETLKAKSIDCVGVSRPEFDLMDPESIARSISSGFDLVVNAAAWTDVDGAEENEDQATRANAEAVGEIASVCKRFGSTLITYSTDYVFSGNADSPYQIDAPIQPINAYGRSKALGESQLKQSEASSILIRTSWVYAPWGSNFIRTIRALARSRDELRVVDDQRGRPTSAQHLAEGSLKLYMLGASGIWHLSDEGECTWFELASAVLRHSHLDCSVAPCSSEEFPRPAPRPRYSTLDIDHTTKLIGHPGSWQEHLHQVLPQITD